jgi:hypothetical protein
MKTQLWRSTLLLGLAILTAGCLSKKMKSYSSSSSGDIAIIGYSADGAPTYEAPASVPAGQDRMLAWKASYSIEVWNTSNAVAQAEAIAAKNGGYVEYKSDDRDGYASLKLRIPVDAFTNAVGALENLGTVTSRNLENEDVTEQYVDLDARLKNRIVLRDRLRQLLDKATEVKDILAIETELNRVQGDIDSMEARIKALQGRVDFATLDLSIHRKQILGPLGLAFKGLFWTVEKLFVIRD